MERKDHVIMISAFVIVALISLVVMYNNSNSTGNVVLDSNELSLINCKEENNWRVCDIQYPNEIRKEAYKEKIS